MLYDHGNNEVRQILLDIAEDKLLGDARFHKFSHALVYAVLSQRLALDTNTTNHFFYSPTPLRALRSTHEQIAKHMRVCVAIEDQIRTLRGVPFSEPILSEAASRIMMSTDFSLPYALWLVLSGKYCINKEDCGELIVASFFTWARDQVVKNSPPLPGQLCPYFSVIDLFRHLLTDSTSMLDDEPSLCHPDDPPQSFGTVFKNAMMHFNHLVRPQDENTLTRPYLLNIMTRGAAALGANFQPDFDPDHSITAVYPYLYGGTDLDINKVGFIIVKVKNDSTAYEAGSLDELFTKMDPFDCNLINDKDKEDGRFRIPIIRIIFLLSGNGNSFKRHTYTPGAAGKKPPFTSYDYVCSGVDDNFLAPTKGAVSMWQVLLDKRDDWASDGEDEANEYRPLIDALMPMSGKVTSWVSSSPLERFR